MKQILTVLTLLSLSCRSQTKVEAENYTKGNNVQEVPADLSIKTVDKSYADYPISVSKSGYYIFKMTVRNGTAGAYINIKLPTSKTTLASVVVPVGDWQEVTAKVKLSKTSKKIRFVSTGSFEMNNFTYTPILDTAKPPVNGVSQADFNALKATVDGLTAQSKTDNNSLKVRIDSLLGQTKINNAKVDTTMKAFKIDLENRIIVFDSSRFKILPDGVTVTIK